MGIGSSEESVVRTLHCVGGLGVGGVQTWLSQTLQQITRSRCQVGDGSAY